MDYLLRPSEQYKSDQTLTISGSKSESNRLLILQALFPKITIDNLSDSDDTRHLKKALQHHTGTIDIGHAGTAMRFLTAYYASTAGSEVILTGSDRMQQRPVKILVDALLELGAQIEYLNNEGYPPLKITGKELTTSKVDINAGVSSQYISALLLNASKFKNGLELSLKGNLTSRPYIEMTTKLLQEIGAFQSWEKNENEEVITITSPSQLKQHQFTVESDWSSAGYWYSWVALQAVGYQIELHNYKKDSLQGDKRLVEVYESFGVLTTFMGNGIRLEKVNHTLPEVLEFDLTDIPDQAQTIFVTALGLKVELKLKGLHTLKIKETDRIEALKLMGLRFRESVINTTHDSLHLLPSTLKTITDPVEIETFNDHRMALAFAPLSCKVPLMIKDAGVVTKSYVSFWDHLKSLNVPIAEI